MDPMESSTNIYLYHGGKRRLCKLTWKEQMQQNLLAAKNTNTRMKAQLKLMAKKIDLQAKEIGLLRDRCEALEVEKAEVLEKCWDLEQRVEGQDDYANEQEPVQRTHGFSSIPSSWQIASTAGTPADVEDTDTDDSSASDTSSVKEDHCALQGDVQDIFEGIDMSMLGDLNENLLGNFGPTLASSPLDEQRMLGSVVEPGALLLLDGTAEAESSQLLDTRRYSKSSFDEMGTAPQLNYISNVVGDIEGENVQAAVNEPTQTVSYPKEDMAAMELEPLQQSLSSIPGYDQKSPMTQKSNAGSKSLGSPDTSLANYSAMKDYDAAWSLDSFPLLD